MRRARERHSPSTESPFGRKYSFSGAAGLTSCEGPQFWAVPVVPCAQDITGRPSFGALPSGAMTSPVEIVGMSAMSEET